MNKKKIPQRMCIVCGEMQDKKMLIRIVRSDTQISVDPGGKMNGRGAYICRKPECIENLQKKHALDRAFSMKVDDSVVEMIRRELSEQIG